MATTTTYRTGNYPCRVYTALLTQSDGDDPNTISNGPVTVGVTYEIVVSAAIGFWDFSNVGGPVYPETYTFVATASEEPNSWAGVDDLNYNNGAPVVTVLENTIGNIWFSYGDAGSYVCNSNGLFSLNKTTGNSEIFYDGNNDAMCGMYTNSFTVDNIIICSTTLAGPGTIIDNILNRVLIEIRVYN